MPKYCSGDIVKISSHGKSTLGLIKQVDGDILLVGSEMFSTEDFEIEVLHREVDTD